MSLVPSLLVAAVAPSSRADIDFDTREFYRIGSPIAVPVNDSVARITLSFHLADRVAAVDERSNRTEVEAAARAQAETGDCMNAPGPVMVDLAELLTQTVRHADWAILAKNGTDATTMCCTIARAQTGRSKILVAKGAYHGAAPWCTPRPAGTTAADHANLGHYTFNDLASVRGRVLRAVGHVSAPS